MRHDRLFVAALVAAGSLGAPLASGEPDRKGSPAAFGAPWGDIASVGRASRPGVLPVQAPGGGVLPLAMRADVVVSLPTAGDSTGVLRILQLDDLANGIVMATPPTSPIQPPNPVTARRLYLVS